MKKSILMYIVGALALCLGACTQQKAGTEVELNWATFNIRYANQSDSLDYWGYRKDTVATFILENDLDIVGMQEVLHSQMEDLKVRLPEYEAVGVGRDDGKQKGEYSPLFFKKDRFEVMDSNTFWLSQYPDSVGFVGWDGACCRIATWAKLKDKATGKVFMAVNTHFDHVGVEAQKNGALLIIDKIKEIVGDQPAVLTGDFNVTDESEAYNTIVSNEFVLKDAHKIAKNVEGVNHTYHGFGRIPAAKCSKIDFIFVTPQIQVERSFVPANVEGQPGKNLSDHNPQIVKVSF